jgi:hypothetical protein
MFESISAMINVQLMEILHLKPYWEKNYFETQPHVWFPSPIVWYYNVFMITNDGLPFCNPQSTPFQIIDTTCVSHLSTTRTTNWGL